MRLASLPGRFAIFKSQRQRVSALDHFAGQSQVGSILLYLGAGDFNRVVRLEHHAHVVEKFLGTKKNLDRIRRHSSSPGTPRAFAPVGGTNFNSCNYALERALRGGIVFAGRPGKKRKRRERQSQQVSGNASTSGQTQSWRALRANGRLLARENQSGFASSRMPNVLLYSNSFSRDDGAVR